MARGLPRLSPAMVTAMATATMERGPLRQSPATVMATMERGLLLLSPAMVMDIMARGLPKLSPAMVTVIMARGLPKLSPAMVTAMATATMDEDATMPKYLHCAINREFSTMSPDAKKLSS